jgi:aspartate-semialdehyde dehydrogenase
MQMMVALKPLHDAATIEHVVVSTYQAASGKGQAALEELRQQTREIAAGGAATHRVFPGPLAHNVLSDWVAGHDGYSEEECKIIEETRKILKSPNMGVSPTCVRVPVETGHSEAIHLRFARPMYAEEARRLLAAAPGLVLVDTEYAPGSPPQPIQAAGTDPVYVGRVRDDLTRPGTLNLWVVADNLRKGAALNAVQLAELLV